MKYISNISHRRIHAAYDSHHVAFKIEQETSTSMTSLLLATISRFISINTFPHSLVYSFLSNSFWWNREKRIRWRKNIMWTRTTTCCGNRSRSPPKGGRFLFVRKVIARGRSIVIKPYPSMLKLMSRLFEYEYSTLYDALHFILKERIEL